MNDILNKHLNMIKIFYGESKAKRSNVPYINHITEGLEILDGINADEYTKSAYCVHPMIQLPNSLRNVYESNVYDIDSKVLLLAMEYRNKANSYLCRPKTDNYTIVDLPYMVLDEVKHMLIADKVQNYKDFLLYHKDTHERTKELDKYFNLWFEHLGINYEEIVKFIK